MFKIIFSFLVFVSMFGFFSACSQSEGPTQQPEAKPEAAVKTHVSGESPNESVRNVPRIPKAGGCPHTKAGGCPHASETHGKVKHEHGHVHGKGCSHGHDHTHADNCANCEGCKGDGCANCPGCKDGCANCEGCKGDGCANCEGCKK